MLPKTNKYHINLKQIIENLILNKNKRKTTAEIKRKNGKDTFITAPIDTILSK